MRRSLTIALVVAILVIASSAHANPFIPGPAQQTPIALMGGTIHPVDGPAVEGGVLLFDQGKIVALGTDVRLPEGTLEIDVTGKHVYPGLIDAYTNVGLAEISAVRATRDQSETGRVNPNVKAQVAINPDTEIIPVARSGGVLHVVTAPTGGLISGTSAVIHLDGWTWEDMTVRADAGMHVAWPRTLGRSSWRNPDAAKQQNERRQKDVKALQQAFDDARAHYDAKQAAGKPGTRPPRHDSRWEAMIPVLEGKVPLIVRADDATQIQSAVAFAEREKVRLIILGGFDAPDCAALLKKHDVPVIVYGVHRLPRRRDQEYDAAFTVPARLHDAGIKFCIAGAERLGNERNLPHHAATAAAYGLPEDVALRSITLSAAEILGTADRLGSLTPGKDASLIVTDGNVLEVTSRVEQAFIQGRKVDLADKQKLLWKKYREKYRRQREGAATGEE